MSTSPTHSKSRQSSATSFSMKCYFNEIKRYPLLSREEERALGARIRKDGDPAALETMINANLRLVVKIANDYANCGLPVEDLISEGNIGLMKAARRFDPKFGVKFSTYAAWWIKQGIKRALGNQSRTIRLPLHVLQSLRNIDQAEQEPDGSARLRSQGLTPEKIAELRRVSKPVISLDEPAALDGSVSFGNLESIILGEPGLDPSTLASEVEMNHHLREALGTLSEREREIIACRYGLDNRDLQTLEEIGVKFGVTRERIRQIQTIAIEKLRLALERLERPIVKNSRPRPALHKIPQPSPQLEAIPA